MGGWLARRLDGFGYTSRDEYRRWLALIIPTQILLLAAIWLYGRGGIIHFSPTPWSLILFVVGLAYMIGLFILTARRFRSAGLSRGWLLLTILTASVPIGPFYWNISVTVMLLAIFVGSMVADVPENERVY
jgi:uncharacterized membrane protein YhaH (DUF805 family)